MGLLGKAECVSPSKQGNPIVNAPPAHSVSRQSTTTVPDPTATPTIAVSIYMESLDISSGPSHTCALLAEGKPVCWGVDKWGKASPPSGERFVAITSGRSHTCGLKQDGTATCWGGRYDDGALTPPEDRFTAISSGDSQVCGLRTNGTAVCWGYGEAPVPDEPLASVSNGGNEACALRTDGTPVCWAFPIPGFPPFHASSPPSEKFVTISRGTDHACGPSSQWYPRCVGVATSSANCRCRRASGSHR